MTALKIDERDMGRYKNTPDPGKLSLLSISSIDGPPDMVVGSLGGTHSVRRGRAPLQNNTGVKAKSRAFCLVHKANLGGK